MDPLVVVEHVVFKGPDLHEPGCYCLVNERRIAAVTEGIPVLYRAAMHQPAFAFYQADDRIIGVKDGFSGEFWNFFCKFSLIVDRAHDRKPQFFSDAEVIFAECRRDMDDARPVFGRNEIRDSHFEKAGREVFKIVEQGFVRDTNKFRPRKFPNDLDRGQVFIVRGHPVFGHDKNVFSVLYFYIAYFRAHGQRHVRK